MRGGGGGGPAAGGEGGAPPPRAPRRRRRGGARPPPPPPAPDPPPPPAVRRVVLQAEQAQRGRLGEEVVQRRPAGRLPAVDVRVDLGVDEPADAVPEGCMVLVEPHPTTVASDHRPKQARLLVFPACARV